MSGTRFRVVDDNLEAVVPGEKGELIIIGAQVTDSYWRNPGKTHDAFITLPDGTEGYRSGDLVFESHSEFYYCGRRDNQLKVDGYRVEGGEIEFHARQFEQVRDAALVGRTTDSGSTVLHLFLLSDLSLDESWLRDCKRTLAQRLPSYMVPHKIHVLSTFPLNQNGKVDRRTLLARVQEG
jgi:D-alanine--poly(phosphoribitol) ligase subunit 1